jgi:hypothetical protein
MVLKFRKVFGSALSSVRIFRAPGRGFGQRISSGCTSGLRHMRADFRYGSKADIQRL